MNDDPTIPPELAAHAARAVHPLAAGPRRKRAMREELLAHLLDAFAEERSRHPPDSAATAAARRLGDPAELRHQLQASVPRLEAALFACLPRKEDPVSRSSWIAGTVAAAIGLVFMVGLAIVMPAAALIVRQARDAGVDVHLADERLKISLIALVLFGAAVTFTGLAAITYGTVRTLRARRLA
jgi:hypothetical protein